MDKLYCLIRVAFQTKFAYIKAFWFNIFGTAVSILIYYFLWKYVFMSREELHGFTVVQMTTYVVLSRTLSSQFSGGINKEFAEWVYKGNIVVELLRPIHLAFNLFGKRLGEFFFFLLFKGIPIGILGTLLLGGCGPAGVVEFLLFFVSVLVSIGILFWIEVAVGIWPCLYQERPFIHPVGRRGASLPFSGECGESPGLPALCGDGDRAGLHLSWKILHPGGGVLYRPAGGMVCTAGRTGNGLLPESD